MIARTEVQARPDLKYERVLWIAGHRSVAGIDEAGRGALAGPVVAAAVVLPTERRHLGRSLSGVRDSKRMAPAERDHWAAHIEAIAVAVGVGMAAPAEVDAWGIIGATRTAISRALSNLPIIPDHLLLDYILLPEEELPQTSLARGDSQILSIAAASVIAKVARDRRMVEHGAAYPGYGFEHNKGYGTPRHKAALNVLGPTPIHRMSYAPVAACRAVHFRGCSSAELAV